VRLSGSSQTKAALPFVRSEEGGNKLTSTFVVTRAGAVAGRGTASCDHAPCHIQQFSQSASQPVSKQVSMSAVRRQSVIRQQADVMWAVDVTHSQFLEHGEPPQSGCEAVKGGGRRESEGPAEARVAASCHQHSAGKQLLQHPTALSSHSTHNSVMCFLSESHVTTRYGPGGKLHAPAPAARGQPWPFAGNLQFCRISCIAFSATRGQVQQLPTSKGAHGTCALAVASAHHQRTGREQHE
jgi:hypothetical protein